MKKKILILFILLIFGTVFSYFVIERNYTVQALSKYGSQGQEVRQIQEKLKRWGYYNGSIDRNIW